jgi:hypothetical protein
MYLNIHSYSNQRMSALVLPRGEEAQIPTLLVKPAFVRQHDALIALLCSPSCLFLLQSPASFGDQQHRGLAHPVLIMKLLAPC